MKRSSAIVLLLSLLSLSFLPVSFADSYCPINCQNSDDSFRCSCGTCYCDNNNYPYCSGGCGTSGGTIAGIVIAVIVGIGLLLCLMSLCYRRRYYNTAGRTTYSTGGPTAVITNTSVPMQAVPVGGYGGSQPMQAIPVQYAQYPSPSQPAAYNPYGSTYAQTPVGGGQPINNNSPPGPQPPAYSAYPSAPSNDIQYPSKPSQYDGERAI